MRPSSQRKADVLARLARESNIWLATASDDAVPHMIPLSLAWDGVRILVATPTDSPTVRNVRVSRRVKAALDSAEDVVLIDGTVDVLDFAAASEEVVTSFVRRVGWDPTDEPGEWSLLIVTPDTVRAWNSVGEIKGRTIMKQGAWLV